MKHLSFSFWSIVLAFIAMTLNTDLNAQTYQKFLYYMVEEGQVWYTGQPRQKQFIEQAHADSFFEIRGSVYAKDKNRVYFSGKLLDGADATTFEAVTPRVGRDSKRVYFADKLCATCDAGSFKTLSREIYADRNNVYDQYGKPVPEADASTFEVLQGGWYSKDKNAAYSGISKLSGIDVASFSAFSCKGNSLGGLAQDKNRCYFFSQPVPCNCAVPEVRFEKASQVLPDTGLVRIQVPFNELYSAMNSITPTKVFVSLSSGYWRVRAGRQLISLDCKSWADPNGGRVKSVVELDIKPGSVQVIKEKEKSNCELELVKPALITGQNDWPNVQVQFADDAKPRYQRAVPAGSYEFAAVCSYVTRNEIQQAKVPMKQELEAGVIYKITATFDPATSVCDVKLTR